MSMTLKKSQLIFVLGSVLALFSACRPSDGLLSGLDRGTNTAIKGEIAGDFPGCIAGKAIDAGRIQIDFAFPDGAKKMSIERDGIMVFSTSDPKVSRFIDHGLSEDANYLYTCTAQMSGGRSVLGSESLNIKTISTSSPEFKGIISSKYVLASKSISLKWNTVLASSVPAAAYKIYANVGSSVNWDADPIATITDPGQLSAELTASYFKDEAGVGLGDELVYAFGVRACANSGVCDENVKATTITVPDEGAPKTEGHHSLSVSNGTVLINAPWHPSQGAVAKRMLYVATSATGPYNETKSYQVSDLTKVPTSLSIENLPEGSRYFLLVVDVDPSGNSNFSRIQGSKVAVIDSVSKPPIAPTELLSRPNFVGAKSFIALSWADNSSNESGFKIERSSDGVSYAEIATVEANFYEDSGLIQDKKYFYRVKAFNAGGVSEASNVAAALIPSAPRKIIGLKAVAGSEKVELSWTASDSNGTIRYQVYRAESNGEFSPLLDWSATLAENNFADLHVENGVQYSYIVTALNESGEGLKSDQVTAMPNSTPRKPGAVLVSPKMGSSTKLIVQWTDASSNENGFKIERKNAHAGSYAEIGRTLANINSFESAGLEQGQSYVYRVSAFNDLGVSEGTESAEVFPPNAPESLQLSGESGSKQVVLNWSLPEGSEKVGPVTYKVFRVNSAPGAENTALSDEISATSFTDKDLVNGVAYSYQVRVTNAVGVSVDSNIFQITPRLTVGFVWPSEGSAIASSQLTVEGSCDSGVSASVQITPPQGPSISSACQANQFSVRISVPPQAGAFQVKASQTDSLNKVKVGTLSLKRELPSPTSVKVGLQHACAIFSGGVKCWGANGYKQAAPTTLAPGEVFEQIAIPSRSTEAKVTELALGSNHSCALLENGEVRCWGRGIYGQLGLGQGITTNASTPEKVNLPAAAQITSGSDHTCALTRAGDVYCWGLNVCKRVGANRESCWGDSGGSAYSADNKTVFYDHAHEPVKINSSGTWKAKFIQNGYTHSCAITDEENSRILCWGKNDLYQLAQVTNAPAMYPTPVEIKAKIASSQSQLSKATSLLLGYQYGCAIIDKGYGGTYCWGNGTYGPMGIVATSDTYKLGAVAAFPGHTLLEGWATQVAVGYSTCGIFVGSAPDSKVLKCSGSYSPIKPMDSNYSTTYSEAKLIGDSVTKGREPVSGSINNTFGCVIFKEGAEKPNTLRCWGTTNSYGQLGIFESEPAE